MITSNLRPVALFALSLLLNACFYPPRTQVPPIERTQVELKLPYDLALDAVMHVITAHAYRVQANDPTHGIIEAQTVKFTPKDADCGIVGSAFGKEAVEPTQDSSAVYTFHVKPDGPEASTVSVQGIFATPLRVPFHPLSNAECISRGVQERKLLKEVEAQAAITRRPVFKTGPVNMAPAQK